MATIDKSKYKNALREYLARTGREGKKTGGKEFYHCPNPAHADGSPSAVLYEDNAAGSQLCCMSGGGGCDKNFDIYDVAGFDNNTDKFPEQFAAVDKVFHGDYTAPKPKPKPKKKKIEPVALEKSEAEKIYTKTAIMDMLKYVEYQWGTEIAQKWPIHTASGKIIGINIKFTGGEKAKVPVTFWYNGQRLKTASAPPLIYNLHEVKKGKPIVIHEGCKCGELGKILEQTTSLGFTGGTHGAGKIDWAHHLADVTEEIYIWPDNDKQVDNDGELWPPEKQPGMVAALAIQKQLPHAKIIPFMEKIKDIAKSDIEQALENYTPDEITKYILFGDWQKTPEPEMEPPIDMDDEEPKKENVFPFEILGIADSRLAYFITYEGHLYKSELDKLSKIKLQVLAPLSWWSSEYNGTSGTCIDRAIDDLIRFSSRKDFNIEILRGRGAWRNKNGGICYNDGQNVTGDHDDDLIYVRLPKADIGINDKTLSAEMRHKIKRAVFNMSFETSVDAIRTLGWSVLAPFCGALKWRPSVMVTGPSGSGKTTVVNFVMLKLSSALSAQGTSTVAGIRGRMGLDSGPVILEEFEPGRTRKEEENRKEMLDMIRTSSGDDSPDVFRGTKTGSYMSYKMQNMFAFNSIDPTMDNDADENRIFRVNMVKSEDLTKWKTTEADLIKYLTPENCRAARASAWQALPEIIALADEFAKIINSQTRMDYRTSYADAMMCAAYFVIYNDKSEYADNKEKFFENVFKLKPPEKGRNHAVETIDSILTEKIEILTRDSRTKLTVHECLIAIYKSKNLVGDDIPIPEFIEAYTDELSRIGIRLHGDHGMAIMRDHKAIRAITRQGKGYGKILERHPDCTIKALRVSFPFGQRHCTIIDNIIPEELRPTPEPQQELSLEEKIENVGNQNVLQGLED
jgi:hypothetical protein